MRAVIQRVTSAQVSVDGKTIGEINHGLVVLVGISVNDSLEDVKWLASKIIQLRVFSDEHGKMNNNIQTANGNVLVISQFTLHAKYKKGTRPSFIHAAKPPQAIPLYEAFKTMLSSLLGKKVESGEFGANMQVSLTNDGPVTLVLDTHHKE